MKGISRGSSTHLSSCFCFSFITILSLLWLLAIIKVFMIDNSIQATLEKVDYTTVPGNGKLPDSLQKSDNTNFEYHLTGLSAVDKIPVLNSNEVRPRFSEWTQNQQTEKIFKVKINSKPIVKSTNSENIPEIPSSNKEPDQAPIDVLRPPPPAHVYAVNKDTIQPNQLKWPPVLPDYTIPEREGYDIMPMTGVKVPKFWEPILDPNDPNAMMKIGRYVGSEPTIFLMIASYRDFQCRETITSAYLRADHPERLFVGAVDQLVPGDVGCLDIDIPCSVDNTQMICKYRDQISIYKMDAQYATGPVAARHIGDRMYRGEYFVMQMDAHCLFINHWDTKIIGQVCYRWNKCVLCHMLCLFQCAFIVESNWE